MLELAILKTGLWRNSICTNRYLTPTRVAFVSCSRGKQYS